MDAKQRRARSIREEELRRKRRKALVVLTVIAAAGAAVGTWRGIVEARRFVAGMDLFTISDVRVVPAEAAPSVLSCLPDLRGRSILFLNLAEITKSVAAYNRVRTCRVLRIFPSTLEIRVELRRPWVRIAGADTYIDRDGFVVPAPADTRGFLSVSGLALTRPPDEEYGRRLALLREVEKWYNACNVRALFAAEEIDISDPRAVVLRSGNRSVRMRPVDIRMQYEKLVDILRTCQRQGKDWEYIDLRWEHPSGKLKDERRTPDSR